MKSNNKRASIFVYVLILINIALIIGYVVYNNTYILNNNISIWRNAEEVFATMNDKWNINIESVRQYNWNWWGYTDFISCPTNITMSWTTNRRDSMTSEMYYDFGTVYCYFEYNWEWVRLYFDPDTQEYTRAYYDWDLKNINNWFFWSESEIRLSTSNVDNSNTTSAYSSSYSISNIFNSNTRDQYISQRSWWQRPQLTLNLWSPVVLSKIIIKKDRVWSSNYWNNWVIEFISPDWSTVSSTLSWLRNDSNIEVNFSNWHFSTNWGVSKIRIYSTQSNKYLNISWIEIYEWVWVWTEQWSINSNFDDSDDTYLFFDSTWVGGNDLVDDNMNSDNYRSTSTGSIWYPWDFLDDDITPRTTIFTSILPNQDEYYNVFWNNHLTNEFVDNNIHNNDNPIRTVKIWEVTDWILKFDMFTLDGSIEYDLKIIEFDRDAYRERKTLLPVNVYETLDVNQNYWYLQINWDTLSLSPYKTWNEFSFNFKENDYSIYLTNWADENLAIRINWEEAPSSWNINDTWRIIYINPIDDSKESTIETMVNHILVGWEKNYIWENFIMVWNK